MSGLKALFAGKAVPFWVAALFIIPGFVLGSQYAFYESVPEWKKDDSWTYKTTFTMSGMTLTGPDGQEMATEGPQTEESIFTMKVVNDSAEVDGVPAYEMRVLGKMGSFPAGFISKATLNPIAPKFENGTPAGHEELPLFQWPLTPGTSWTYDLEDMARLKFSAANRDWITVADETLMAIRIDVTVDEILDPETKKAMDEGKIDADLTFSYWYADAVRNIARGEFRIDATLTDDSGARISFKAESLMELVKGTGLEAAPADADLGSVDELLLKLPEALNLLESKSASFTAEPKGQVPEGAVYKWTIDGDEYLGQTVDAKFDAPGLKEVDVQLYKDNMLLAEAIGIYEVYTSEEVQGAHTLTGGTKRHELEGQMGGFIRLLYQSTGAMGPLANPQNDLTLYDPEGEPVMTGPEIMMPVTMEGTYEAVVRASPAEYVSGGYTLLMEVRYDPRALDEAIEAPMAPSSGIPLFGGFFQQVERATLATGRAAASPTLSLEAFRLDAL